MIFPFPHALEDAAAVLSFVMMSTVVCAVTGFYRCWRMDFSHRHSRRSKLCPSNKNTPETISLPPRSTVARSRSRKTDRSERKTMKSLRARSKSLTPRSSTTDNDEKKCGSLVSDAAPQLDIDHVYVDFCDFLWFQLFVFPGLVTTTVVRTISLRIRDCLFRRGWTWIKHRHDEATTAARLLLEISIAINYKGRSIHDVNTAIFEWSHVPTVGIDGSFRIANNFEVHLDLRKRKVVAAWLEKEPISMSECLTLLLWGFALEHQKLHGFTNWGVNHEKEQREQNPDLAFQSVITTGYNHLGYTGFGRLDTPYRLAGHLSPNNAMPKFKRAVEFVEKHGVAEHSRISELVKHSAMIRFTVGLRLPFLREFAKYKERYFPGCDGEALFVATVVHSMDHLHIGKILVDPLWCNVDCEKFGFMAEHIRVALFYMDGFASFPFSTKMKDSTNPFFRAVYAHALKIDAHLADALETCVCK